MKLGDWTITDILCLIVIPTLLILAFCIPMTLFANWGGTIPLSVCLWFFWMLFIIIATSTPNIGAGHSYRSSDDFDAGYSHLSSNDFDKE